MDERMALLATSKAASHTDGDWHVRITEFQSEVHSAHTHLRLVDRKVSFQKYQSMEQDAKWLYKSIRPKHRSDPSGLLDVHRSSSTTFDARSCQRKVISARAPALAKNLKVWNFSLPLVLAGDL